MNSICFNGKIVAGDEPVLLAANRSYRYGDGLFETMKIKDGNILLAFTHFERLFGSLSLLKFDIPLLFSKEKLEKDVLHLCRKNGCEKLARVRLSVFRGNGGLYDDNKTLQYIIECWPLNESVNKINENGLVIDIYPDGEKSCDKFSNLKSASFQLYSMAALFAKENKLNDSLVLNTAGRIADSTIANIFLIKAETIFTPSLKEGCINGVMRKYLLEKLKAEDSNQQIEEKIITVSDVKNADEIFLTNAINGIRWVGQCSNTKYTNTKIIEIHNRFIKTIMP